MKDKSRGIVILYEDVSEYWISLLKEAGLTTLGIHKIAIPGQNSINTLLGELDAPHGRDIINSIERAGITVEFELHALEWLLPRELFKERPEYFRMTREGIRSSDYNLCPSNNDALGTVSENAYRLAKELKQNSDNYYLWPDDAAGSHCRCESCSTLNNADQAMLTANAVLKGLRAYNPRTKLSFLSYGDTLQIPAVKPDPGVFLEFAPMNRDHGRPVYENRIYSELLPRLLEIFRPEESHVLEYWLDNALYSGYRRPPVKVPFLPDVAEADVKYYTELGIKNIKTFGSFIGDEYFALHGRPPIREYGMILNKYIS